MNDIRSILYASMCGFASGILLRSFFIIDAYGLLMIGVASVGGICIHRLAHGRQRQVLLIGTVLTLSCVLGIVRMESAEQVFAKHEMAVAALLGSDVQLEGRIVRNPERREETTILTVNTDTVAREEVRMVIEVRAMTPESFIYGDRVSVTGTLQLPSSFETDTGRTFPYRGFMRARGVSHTIAFGNVEKQSAGNRHHPLALLYALKGTFIRTLKNVLPEPSAGLAQGLLLGEKHALRDDLEEAFRIVGVIHIVVLSGYNLSIVAEFLMRLLARVATPRTRLVVGGSAILLFSLMVGLTATVLRATLMAILVLIARATGRTYDVLRALALSGFAMVVHNPYILAFDPGFQLSFLATFGLIALAPAIERRLTYIPIWGGLREYATATIATQLFLTPFLLYALGAISLIAVIGNMLILIAVPPAMFLSALTIAIGLIDTTLAYPIGYMAHLLLAYIVVVAERLSHIPYAMYTAPQFPLFLALCVYAIGGALTAYILHRKLPGKSGE